MFSFTAAPVSSEAQLACTALRVELGRDAPSALRDRLNDDLDPERVRQFCVYHGIAPSVHRGLRAGPDTSAAAAVRESLAPPVQACAAAGLHKARVLEDILQRFSKADIAVMPLKGTGLDVRFYDGPGRRKDSDHDLLVRPEQLSDAAAVLSEMGFQSSNPEALPPAQWPDEMDKHHGPPLLRLADRPTPVPVELHWNVSPSEMGFPLRDPDGLTQGFWKRSEAGTLLGAPVRWPSPTDEAFLLLLHAVRHLTYGNVGLYFRLAMLEDLARVTDCAPNIVPSRLRARAQRAGPVHLLGPMRYLWRQVLGPVPSWLEAKPETEWPPAWGQGLLSVSHLLGDGAAAQDRASRPYVHKLHATLVCMLLLQRPADQATLLRRFTGELCTPNEKDFQAIPFPLPPGTHGLYRLVRLVRLLGRLLPL